MNVVLGQHTWKTNPIHSKMQFSIKHMDLVPFQGLFHGQKESAMGLTHAGWEVHGELLCSDFGITTVDNGLSDKVKLEMFLEFIKEK